MTKKSFDLLFTLRGSVIPSILPKVIFCIIFSIFISILDNLGFPVFLPILSSVVPSIVLGLLLVFRTNTAYERFWEGRKLWGQLTNTIRNLARMIWTSIKENDAQDQQNKIKALYFLLAFAIATKLHLRNENINHELEPLMSKVCFEKLKNMNNPPLEIGFWIGDYLQNQYDNKSIDTYQLMTMVDLLNNMINILGGCERILKTPIPLAYAIHLKQLLFIYCLSLPFQIVKDLGLLSGIVVGIISFTVFGIEQIGIEIENPFGHDPNDLPLDTICLNMERNIEDLMTISPSVSHW
jgi:ion channel-forming bestrophin family protein